MCTGREKLQSLCLLVGALLFLILTGCAQNPVTGAHDFVTLSEDSEIKIGRTNHPKIIKQFGRYEDERLQAYVQAVGDKLAIVSHRQELTYRFTVLDSPVINAFALPGGYIYITRGLMSYLNSEAELAAVLGHEIGHVTARHGVRQQSAAQAANFGYIIGSILFPELRGAGSQNVFNILGGALLSGYGREHELESDGLGAEYLAKAGYDPKAMIDVIRVLKDQEIFAAAQAKKQGRETQGYHGLFASHPDNDTRLQAVVGAAEKLAKSHESKRLRAEYLTKINGMAFGDSEEQGIRSDRNFYHLALKFAMSFPPNWQINNNPDSLQAISPGGNAFIEMGTADINKKLSPQDFIKTRLKIDNLKSGKKLKSNGLEGYTGLVKLKDKLGRVSVVYLKDRAFIFFASTKDAQHFSKFDVDFITTAKSLHRLREDEIQLAKGLKIEIVSVGKRDNYAAWSKHSHISNSPIQQLRLLNGDYPNGELKKGQLAKRVK
ncbi:MAG: peptidase [Methylophaga sp.]|nr:MAG: peptidase [Methylophaga sp.]